MPNTPALSCLQFVFQGAAIGGAAAALDLSNAVIVQLGQQPARANQ